MNLFGFTIGRTNNRKDKQVPTPITPSANDGSTVVVNSGNSAAMCGYFQYNFDIDGVVRNDMQMINIYRSIASYPDVSTAIDSIVNEALIVDQSADPVSINLDQLPEQYTTLKTTIINQFQHVLSILNFNDNCHEIFRRWYIDGKLFYFVIVDPHNLKKGISELKYIDPRKIRKITEYTKSNKDGITYITDTKQYYLFNDDGLTNAQKGIRLSTDSVINVRSGLVDANSGEVVSYLFKAIKPTNQLKMMEDSLVIYRITRAPERRVFYVDVGNLPGQKAEQYVSNIMNKFRNKVVYDPLTGEIKNNRQYTSMVEDMFIPRREGGKSTEITTLPGGSNLAQIEDVEYFQRKLYQALNVPRQRLQSDNLMSIGNNNEVTREEIAFSKFIQRLRNRFNVLFKEALRIQLLVTKTISHKDWEEIRDFIRFEYQHDNYFEELKRIEIFNQRMAQLQTADSFKGTYFSKQYIVHNVLEMTDDQWKEIKQQIEEEQLEDMIVTKKNEDAVASYESQHDNDDSDDNSNNDYQSFVDGNDDDDTVVDQSGDNTNTIDDDAVANPGEDDFERPATPGLSVAQ